MNMNYTHFTIPLVIIAVNQAFKKYFYIDSKTTIPISWGLGIVLYYLLNSSGDVVLDIVNGFIVGSAASGLYDSKDLIDYKNMYGSLIKFLKS